MGFSVTQVDAFTNRPFAGNPAAVFILPEPQADNWLQSVAQEMNLSETAFLLPQADGYNLRWFTPATEVDLCGHATLASAHVLWSEGYLQPDEPALFQTRSGLLTAQQQGDWIELNFPARPAEPIIATPELSQALRVKPKFVGKDSSLYLVELESESVVRALQPDFALLKTLPVQGVIVTSRADTQDYDFVSRFFAPRLGIDEDPVTGAAHCCLAPFWQERLDKETMVGYQASARGGVVRVRPSGERVYLAGQAITVLRGKLYSNPI